MPKDDSMRFTLRFSLFNKQHGGILNYINNLDLDIYKSKNQFIMDAIEFYIDNYGSIIDSEKREQHQECIKRSEFEQLEKEMKSRLLLSAREYAKDEIIRMLTSACMGKHSYINSEEQVHSELMEDGNTKELLEGLIDSWDAM